MGIIAGKERPLSSNPAKFMFFQERLYFGVSTPQPTLYRINAKLLAPQLVSESVMDFRFAGVCIVLDTFLQDQTFVSLSIDLQNTVNLGTFPETIEWVVQGDRNLFIIGRSRPDQSRLAWMIDGTLEGSREIVIPGDIAPRESWPWLVEDFVGIGRRLFFKGEDQLWGYDFDRKDFKRLSGAPTGEIGKPSVPVMASLNGCLYAVLYNRITGYGLYRFDMSGFDQTAAENWTMFE